MKELKDFPGYFITEDGRVYSAWKQKREKGLQGITTYLDYDDLKEKSLFIDKGGYCIASLYVKGKQYSKKVHRLVAETFIRNPDNLSQVNHIDENKQNNHISNLEWVTPKQNCEHSNCKWIWSIKNLDTNTVVKVINLRDFCRKNDLDHRALYRTLIEKVSHHKRHKLISKLKFK